MGLSQGDAAQGKRADLGDLIAELSAGGVSFETIAVAQQPGFPYPGFAVTQVHYWIRRIRRQRKFRAAESVAALNVALASVKSQEGLNGLKNLIAELTNG